MKFSISYHSKRLEDADEIRCPYNQLGQIYKFIKSHPDKRYNIAAREVESADKLVEQVDIVREIADYTIECGDLDLVQWLRHNDYKAYLRYPVADWETFCALRTMDVSDIYIDGALGFQSRELLRGKGAIQLRVSPQVSPNAALTGMQPNSFFIRPEDLKRYEKTIDIIDFREQDPDREDALFDIYKRGSFFYNLNELLADAKFSVPNPFIKPEFGEARVNCGQRCMVPTRPCHLCQTQVLTTNTVYKYFTERKKELQ